MVEHEAEVFVVVAGEGAVVVAGGEGLMVEGEFAVVDHGGGAVVDACGYGVVDGQEVGEAVVHGRKIEGVERGYRALMEAARGKGIVVGR